MKHLICNAISELNTLQDLAQNIGQDAVLEIEKRKRKINEWFSKRYDIDADITCIRVAQQAAGEYIETGVSDWLKSRSRTSSF